MRHPLARGLSAGAFAALLAPIPALAGGPRSPGVHAKAGPYQVILEVLPAERFTGPDPAVAWDSGAKPLTLTRVTRANEHLEVRVTRNGKAVTDARVAIRYRLLGKHRSGWMDLPVARMHLAGKGTSTTRYGNNVRLRPGWYQAVVTVDGHRTRRIRFEVAGPVRPEAYEVAPRAPERDGPARDAGR